MDKKKIGLAIKISAIVIGAIGEGICALTDEGPTAELVAKEVAKQMAEKKK